MTDHSKERHGKQHEHHRREEAAHKRPIHHDWRLWVAVLLMIAAMGIYIASMNESIQPDGKVLPPVPAAP
jgi:hypothetical protein